MNLNFDTTYLNLPPFLYTRMEAEGVSDSPFLIHTNPKAATLLDLDTSDPLFPAYFCGKTPLPGATPFAMAYAGHQFGHYAGQLGDGRALVLGQILNTKNERWEIQLKGSGKTPYSRFGDGRAVLRSCIREYLCSEAMHALGVPTTRALCIVGTGESVQREQLEPGAVLTRLAPSHIRFGHFEHLFYSNRSDLVKQLADHVIDLYFPDCAQSSQRYIDWLSEVITRTAHLIAQWQSEGFAHGVLNTDNMSILGLTLDYGPFGFMEGYDPHFICNHSDHEGRYAFDQQPFIGLWNLHALAYALQDLIPTDQSEPLLAQYNHRFLTRYFELMTEKIGLAPSHPNAKDLILSLLSVMEETRCDYPLCFRYLAHSFHNPDPWIALFKGASKAKDWLNHYHTLVPDREQTQARLLQRNPVFILRNWVAEKTIRAAEDRLDYLPLSQILDMAQNPFQESPGTGEFCVPDPTFHKLISCSS